MNRFVRPAVFVVAAMPLLVASSARSASRQVAPPPAVAPDLSTDIQTVDDHLYDAIEARNAAKIGTYLADGFLLTNTFGKVYTRAEFLSACCSDAAAANTQSLSTTSRVVKMQGGGMVAVVSALTHLRFQRNGQNQTLTWRSTRVYVKQSGRWQLVAEQRTSIG
jgi:ketosteroid isomerase-like protein